MKRKFYERPAMTIIKLQHTQMLMASVEGVGAQRTSYGAANGTGTEDVWE